MSEKQLTPLTYKGKPLLRRGNEIFYGNPEDRYIIVLKLDEIKQHMDMPVATSVSIELQVNDTSMREKEKLIKKAHREGLYKALDIAEIWLDDALNA